MLGLVSEKKLKNYQSMWEERRQKMEFEINRLNGEVKNKSKIAFDLNNDILELKAINRDLGNKIDNQAEEIMKLKLQVKQLKTLCTKNHISYYRIFNK